jgi:hypothetical protein
MQMPLADLVEAALALPESERLGLVSRLLESMPADDAVILLDDDSLADDLDRRFADREGSIDWSDLRARNNDA